MSLLSQPVSQPVSSKDKIHEASADMVHEFKNFVSDVEILIKETATLTGDELAQARVKLNQRINAAKQRINSASNSMLDQARKTATTTNEYVHEKPWAVIGAGALFSFILGMLVGHRKENSSK